MKRPQRKFVVEFKSARRRPEAKAKSIWGDMDLSVLADEAADEAPHLFKSGEASSPPGRKAGISPDMVSLSSKSESEGKVDIVQIELPCVGEVEIDIAVPRQDHSLPTEAVRQPDSQPQQRSHVRSRRSAGQPGPVSPRAQRLEGGDEVRDVGGVTIPDAVCVGELAALEAENIRLKKLLAARLRTENGLLKEMLERFFTA